MTDLNPTKEKENHWSVVIMKTSSAAAPSSVLLLRCIYYTLFCFCFAFVCVGFLVLRM